MCIRDRLSTLFATVCTVIHLHLLTQKVACFCVEGKRQEHYPNAPIPTRGRTVLWWARSGPPLPFAAGCTVAGLGGVGLVVGDVLMPPRAGDGGATRNNTGSGSSSGY